MKERIFEDLEKELPLFVFRADVGRIGLNQRTLLNLDSKGLGPEGRIRIGRKIAYKREALIDWLEKRSRKEGP